jgi:hypothetical protein
MEDDLRHELSQAAHGRRGADPPKEAVAIGRKMCILATDARQSADAAREPIEPSWTTIAETVDQRIANRSPAIQRQHGRMTVCQRILLCIIVLLLTALLLEGALHLNLFHRFLDWLFDSLIHRR